MATHFEPIPTIYRNTPFRSRLEARWAVCFDELGIEWRYEAEGFEGNGHRYLPDFYLPQFYHDSTPAWVEIKGREPTEEEFVKATLLAQANKEHVVIITWEDFAPSTAANNIVMWHDENGVFHTERGLDWLPHRAQGWKAARLAGFGHGPRLVGEPFHQAEGRLPY